MASGDRSLFREEVALAPRTTLGIGGSARWLAEVRSNEEIREALEFAKERNLRFQVLGGGSNLVVADEGFDGLVAEIRITGLNIIEKDSRVILDVGAGEVWDDVVEFAVARGLGGIECLSGIPGRVGATPIQNVGAYGQEVSETIIEVRAIDRESGAERVFSNQDCVFQYRHSLFKGAEADRWVITRVGFALTPDAEPVIKYAELEEKLGDRPPSIRAVRFAVLALRSSKGMVIDPADPDSRSVGSYFLNPVLSDEELREVLNRAERLGFDQSDVRTFPVADGRTKVSAAWLIERTGFEKGFGDGNVGISKKHALALINRGEGSAKELLALAQRIREGVAGKFGVNLETEPRVLA